MIAWASILLTFINIYFITLEWFFGGDFIPSLTDYQFSLIPALVFFIFIWKFTETEIDCLLLAKIPSKLTFEEKKQYFIMAIHFL